MFISAEYEERCMLCVHTAGLLYRMYFCSGWWRFSGVWTAALVYNEWALCERTLMLKLLCTVCSGEMCSWARSDCGLNQQLLCACNCWSFIARRWLENSWWFWFHSLLMHQWCGRVRDRVLSYFTTVMQCHLAVFTKVMT